jgi:PAS domain S-box-containing protein
MIDRRVMQITKFRSELFIALDQATVHLQRIQNTLTRLGKSIAEKPRRLQEVIRVRESGLRKLLPNSLHAIVVFNGKTTKFRSELFIASEQVTVHLQRAQNTLTRLGRSVVAKPQRLQEVIRVRENGLRKLLASSLDAIVVTNGDRRFVSANPKALDLFGISETNMGKFTIDAFLPNGQIPDFDGNGPPFIRREERHGKCKVRRLDGSSRVAEYIFVANFVPLRHLSRFRDVTPEKAQVKFITKFNSGRGDIQVPASYPEDTRKSN